MDDLQGLLAQFQPTEEDRRRARQQALMAASLSLLGRPKGAEYQSFGQAGLLGMGLYNQALGSIPQQRLEAMKAYAGLQDLQLKQRKAAQDEQFNALGIEAIKRGMGGGATGTSAGAGGGSGTGFANANTELGFALAGKKEIADVIHRQYQVTQGPGGTLIRNGQIVGQVIPNAGMVIDGKFQQLPQEATNALVEFNTAQKRGEERAKAEQQVVNVPSVNPDGTPGQSRAMTQADYADMLRNRGQPQQPQQTPRYSLSGNFSPEELARIQADANGSNPFPVQFDYNGQRLGVTASPIATKRAESAIDTAANKERSGYSAMVENSKNQYEEIRKAYMASRDLDLHVANMEKLDKSGVFNGPVGEWAGKWANAWNSAFPGSQIEPQKLANSQTFQTEVGKMQQAIARTFPGSQSDRELSALTLSLPTLMASPQGRAQIYDTIRRKIADAKSSYQSASTYYRANDGNLVGWEPPPFTPPSSDYGSAPEQPAGKRYIWNGRQLVPQQ